MKVKDKDKIDIEVVPDKPKHPGGRPTKYRPEYCEDIIKYFEVDPIKIEYKIEYNKDGTEKSRTPITLPAAFPTFQGFAHEIGVNMDTLNEWKNTIKEFSDSYSRAKELQEKIWLINGMNNLYNSQFAQFFGRNCLGYKDKIEFDATVTSQILTDDDRKLLNNVASRLALPESK